MPKNEKGFSSTKKKDNLKNRVSNLRGKEAAEEPLKIFLNIFFRRSTSPIQKTINQGLNHNIWF